MQDPIQQAIVLLEQTLHSLRARLAKADSPEERALLEEDLTITESSLAHYRASVSLDPGARGCRR